MNITDFILTEIPFLTTNSTVEKAKKLFREFPFTHLSLVEDGVLLGAFSESDIQTIQNKNDTLGDHRMLFTYFCATEKTTELELLNIFTNNDCNMVPVLNSTKKYIGYYDLSDVLDVFTSSPFMLEESETLIVEAIENNFSMSTVSQIVETNGGKLLGAYVSAKKAEHIQVTLRIVSQNLFEIIQTFRRYEYVIISSHENDQYLEDLKNRSQYLQKYLKI